MIFGTTVPSNSDRKSRVLKYPVAGRKDQRALPGASPITYPLSNRRLQATRQLKVKEPQSEGPVVTDPRRSIANARASRSGVRRSLVKNEDLLAVPSEFDIVGAFDSEQQTSNAASSQAG